MTWDDETDAILDGDLTAALGYRTPLGGTVVQAVAPIGLRDRASGFVGFTTALGFSKKLVGMARDPRVALAFHAREHGTAPGARYVLVQGRAAGGGHSAARGTATGAATTERRHGAARRRGTSRCPSAPHRARAARARRHRRLAADRPRGGLGR